MPRLHARALVRCRPQVRAVSTAAQAGHSSARAAWSFRGPSFARYWLPASWGAASTALRASSTSNVGAVSSREESLARLVGKGEGSEPLSRQELRALTSTTEGLEAMQPEELVAWVNRWAELDKASLSLEVTRVPPPELCHVIRHIITRLGDTDGQGATWSPGQCARLFFALGQVQYCWEGKEKEDMHALAALLALRIHGQTGKGWRKLSASEISELSAGLGHLELSHMGGLMGEIREECLRRGLDKFKAPDVGHLLYGFTTFSQQPGPELMAAIGERVGRRGYLKGRNGDTTPTDVVRLLRGLSMLEDKPSEELWQLLLERVGKDDGFMQVLEYDELVDFYRACSGLEGEGAQAVMGKALQELDDRTGGLHRADVPIDVLMRVVSGLTHALQKEPDNKVLRRVLGPVLGRVLRQEEGQSSLQPRDLGMLLRAATRLGLANEHPQLLDRLMHGVQQQGFAGVARSSMVSSMLRPLIKAGRYVGHDVMDSAVQKFLELAREEGLTQEGCCANGSTFLSEVKAAQLHGYRPPSVLVETILRWCAEVNTANVRDVVSLHRCLHMLYKVTSTMDGYRLPLGAVEGLVEGLFTAHRARELMAHDGVDRGKLFQSVMLLCKAVEDGVKYGRPSPLVQVRTAMGKLLDEAAAQHAEEGLGKRGLLGGLSISELELLEEEPALLDKLRLIVRRDVQIALAVVRGWGASPLEERLAAAPLVLHCLQRLTKPRWRKLLGPEEYNTLAVAALEELQMHGLEVLEKRPAMVPGLLGLLARLKAPLPSGLLQSLLQAGKQELIQAPPLYLLRLLNALHALPDDPPSDTVSPAALSSLASVGVSPTLPLSQICSTLKGLAALPPHPDPSYVSDLVNRLKEVGLEGMFPVKAAGVLRWLARLKHPEVDRGLLQALLDAASGGPEDVLAALGPLQGMPRSRVLGLLEALLWFDLRPPSHLLDALAARCLYSRVLDPNHESFTVPEMRLALRAFATLPHPGYDRGVMKGFVHALSCALLHPDIAPPEALDWAQCLSLCGKYGFIPKYQFFIALAHAHQEAQGGQGLEPSGASVSVLLQAFVDVPPPQISSRWPSKQVVYRPFLNAQVGRLFTGPHVDSCSAQEVWGCLQSLGKMDMFVGKEKALDTLWGLCHTRLGFEGLSGPALRCLLHSTLKHNMHPGEQVVGRLGQACREKGMANVVEEIAVHYGFTSGVVGGVPMLKADIKALRQGESNPEGMRFLRELLAACTPAKAQKGVPAPKRGRKVGRAGST